MNPFPMPGTASTGNGRILKIEEKGKLKVQIGDEHVFEIDVVAVQDEWWRIDEQFRDADGKIVQGKQGEVNQALWNYVRNLIVSAAGPEDRERAMSLATRMSLATAIEFMARIQEEGLRLQSFFEVKLPERPSSPESTELRFGT